jgi:hypothetical protein
MAGQKKCLSRFKTASGQTLWETMKKAMKDIRYFWPMKYMDAALHNKILANKDKECAPTGYQQCTEGCEKKEMYPSYMMGGTAEKPWRDAGPVFVAKSDLGPFSNYGSWFEWNPMSVKTLSGGKVRSRRQSWAERLRRGCVCRSACVHTCKSVRVRGVRGGWVSSRVLAKWDRLSGNLVGAVGNELAHLIHSLTHTTTHSFTPHCCTNHHLITNTSHTYTLLLIHRSGRRITFTNTWTQVYLSPNRATSPGHSPTPTPAPPSVSYAPTSKSKGCCMSVPTATLLCTSCTLHSALHP